MDARSKTSAELFEKVAVAVKSIRETTEAELQVSGGGKWRGARVFLSFWGFRWGKIRALCILSSAAPWEGGASPGRFKLLSVNVTPCYLDSNYTCQLSLSPHLSLSPSLSVCLFKASHTPLLSAQQDYALILFLSLFICNLPLCQSVLPWSRFSTPLPLRIHCCFNPLRSVLPYTARTQKFNSRQISNTAEENSEVLLTPVLRGWHESQRLWSDRRIDSLMYSCRDIWPMNGRMD